MKSSERRPVKERAWYPVLYMFAASVFFVAILVIFGLFTQDKVDDNQRIAFERATLEALPLDLGEKISPSEIHEIFVELVEDTIIGKDTVYLFRESGELRAYALPFKGAGFWAPIEGVIGIAADGFTITGISFYVQEETPGLGGQIVNFAFRSQFEGKKIAKVGAPLEIRPASEELDENSVHAVTGATQTSTRVARFLNSYLIRWREQMLSEKNEVP